LSGVPCCCPPASLVSSFCCAHRSPSLPFLPLPVPPQPSSQPPPTPPLHKPLDTSVAAINDAIAALSGDGRLAEAFARERWPLAVALDAQGGIPLLLELVHLAAPEDRWVGGWVGRRAAALLDRPAAWSGCFCAPLRRHA